MNNFNVKKYIFSWESLRWDFMLFGLFIIPIIIFKNYFINEYHAFGWILGLSTSLMIKGHIEDKYIRSKILEGEKNDNIS